jgi:catechol 2,3-dioxygenase-like lactoylglutathione lyase family enzyme
MQATRVAVDTFDHFAYPVEALVDAERFYTEVLEMPIFERRGLRVADVIRGTLPRTFLDVAGHRIGLFLGREVLPPANGLFGCPSVGIEITAPALQRIAGRMSAEGVPFAGPAPRVGPGPQAVALRLQDPWGNHLALVESADDGAPGSPYRGISHLELEVTDLEQAEAFYSHALGLAVAARGTGPLDEAVLGLRVPSGQWLLLHQTSALHERSSAGYRFEGQHYAFFAPGERIPGIVDAIVEAGGRRDVLEQTQVRSEASHGCYFTDPDGNPLQVQTPESA